MAYRLKRFFLWFALLKKRLYKKKSFIVLLLCVPLLVVGLSVVASRSEGVVKVALYLEDPTDPVTADIMEKVRDNGSVIGFTECSSRAEAMRRVTYGPADAAWIIEKNLGGAMYRFAKGYDAGIKCVTVVEREESTALMLAREKLSGALSPYLLREAMKEYVRENIALEDDLTDEELNEFFDDSYGAEDIFDFEYSSGSDASRENDLNYLLVPLRGLLAVMIVLCGLAVGMYYVQDNDSQTFYRITRRKRPILEAGYQLSGVTSISAVVLVSLYIGGVGVNPLTEIVSLAVYALAASAFCILVRRLCGTVGRLSAVTPVLIVALIAVSPIFFTISGMKPVQMLTPVYYYLNSIHNPIYLLWMLLYAAVCGGLSLVHARLTEKV